MKFFARANSSQKVVECWITGSKHTMLLDPKTARHLANEILIAADTIEALGGSPKEIVDNCKIPQGSGS